MKDELAANPADTVHGQLPAWKHPVNAVFLTGFMGAGKSTVARDLASLLHWNLIDLDEQIEGRAGSNISQIFAKHGEPYFRELEHRTLNDLVATDIANSVIALGGGTIAQPRNYSLLACSESPVIFLDAPLEELLARCGRATNRPLFRSEEEFRALYLSRLPYYERAHFRVNTARKTSFEIAQEIVPLIGLEVTL